ncbi:hypothetical protein D0Z07_6040 [Hyphodiscus hymeniophilus]|uniref:Myb-like domain-containing protein n=1 Tax=Hyphodiscus hymeniophilus TaxID=353542 RepID=A0A9P6VH43_9HELO|nr:hypothetical protein D0Z07_6040 [Hyphodiscus hymeniophilus]
MAPATGSTWDGASDRDLLLTIIDEGGPGSSKWQVIADKMQAKGYTFTKEACRQHFQKIRKESRSSNPGGPSPVRPGPIVPKTRAPKGTNSAKSTPRKGKSMTDSFATTNGSSNSFDDDDDDMITPSKRKRTVKEEFGVQSAPLFKIEGQGVETKPIDLDQDE